MRPAGPKFWLFGDGLKWPTQRSSGLGISPGGGISLAEDPKGPLGLDSPDQSLGRLALPSGMAFDAALTLYLVDWAKLRILKFQPATQTFQPLPTLGGQGTDRRRFQSLDAIAIQGHRLYIADRGNARVQAFHLQTLALLAEWTAHDVPNGWSPADLAVQGNALYILDSLNGRVLRAFPWTDSLEVVARRSDPAQAWTRITIDLAGRLYVRTAANGITSLEVRDVTKSPAPIEIVPDAASVRDRFSARAILMDAQGRFQLPESLGSACGRQLPGAVARPEALPSNQIAARQAVKRFDANRGSYELDRERREVRVFNRDGQLRSRFGPRDGNGDPADARDPQAWDPYDLHAEGECVFILDAAHQVVWRHRFGSDFLQPAKDHAPWPIPDFRPDALAVRNLWFDADGTPVAPPDVNTISNVRLYLASGFWLSNPIQSAIHRCQWDRIQLTLAPPPPGARIEVLTFAQDDINFSLAEEDPRWDHAYTYVAPLEPPVDPAPSEVQIDFLVQSRPAENLSIQIRMSGDGYETAAIRAMRLYYPRDSYLQFLPKVYSSQDEMRRFLEEFLAVFQITGDQIDRNIQTVERFFDPDAVPEGAPMQFLASWLALTLEGAWDAGQNRKLLSAVPKIYEHRGTPEGFREFIRVYLANAAGLQVQDVAATEFPLVLEGFTERRALMLNASQGPLWSPAAVGRLQLGEFSQLGEVSMVSTGDPDLDFFDQYAHRFKVFVPAAWVHTIDQEKLIRRAIEAEKPAHTAYDLVLVENSMRVGVQSTVGFDTIIGGAVEWRLPCASEGNRLNVNTVLGGAAEGSTVSAGELILT